MNKTLAFAKLDYLTIKSYLNWKTSLLFLAVFGFIGYGTGEPAAAIGMCMMYSVIFACYPFSVGEKNGTDTLYSTLPITKKNIVSGRYAFTIILNLIMLAVSLVVSIGLLTVFSREFVLLEVLLTAFICFAFFSLVEAIQLPIYFKFGYTKAKFLTYLPLLCFPASIIIANNLIGADRVLPFLTNILVWAESNIALTVIIALVAWVGIMCLSAVLSHKFYKNREF